MANILVVEDSPTSLYLTRQALEAEGHSVIEASNGADAVDITTDQQPDLILLDVILPKLNGFQVCRMLKNKEETAHIPIVLVTSKSEDRHKKWGLDRGADEYLIKPVDSQDLIDTVQRLL